MAKIKLTIRPDKDGDIWVYEKGNPNNIGICYRGATGKVHYTSDLLLFKIKHKL